MSLKEQFSKLIHKFNKKDNNDNLNIAYVLKQFPLHSETFVVNEIIWLKENGYGVVVFSSDSSEKPIDLDFDVEHKRFNSLKELESLLIKYDINFMHTHFVYPTGTQFTYPVAEKLKIPFTIFAHAYEIFTYTFDEKNNVGEISKSPYCKAIFTLSDFHKQHLLERGVDPKKIVITKQATGYELIPIKEKENKIKKIISVSRFVEKKGLDVLIDAAKLLENEDYEFSIYGFGLWENRLKKQIRELKCENISIKGELAPEEVEAILIDADLLVSPCKRAKTGDLDGFPTVIFESMAVGLPVLTTSVSAIPEIIKEGKNGFIIEPENPERLAEKIKEISALSGEEMFVIRKQAQRDVANISSVEKTMKTYFDYW